MATALASRCGARSLIDAVASTSGPDNFSSGALRGGLSCKRPSTLFTVKLRRQLPPGVVLCQTSSPGKSPSKNQTWQVLENAYLSSPGSATSTPILPASSNPVVQYKGWLLRDGSPNHRVVAKLHNLAAMAADRAEMHAVLAVQRDNWNHLFNVTLGLATVSAASLSAVQGALHAPSIALTSFLLNAGASAVMAGINFLQPAQLAEEQRTAARFFRNLEKEIQGTLRVDPRLREEATSYLNEKISRLHALDKAFPLPLLPVVLPKFPSKLEPSALAGPVDTSLPEIPVSEALTLNGWTPAIAKDLKLLSKQLQNGDVQEYLDLMEEYIGYNKVLAVASPALAALAAAASLASGVESEQQMVLACSAAGLSVLAAFAHSFTNCFQLGMVFEMYRNCAGFYSAMDDNIQRCLHLPINMREDGELLHQKIAFQLGRPDHSPIAPVADRRAGTLF